MINDIEILKTYREIGCEYVIIPYVNPEHRSGGDKFGELIESAKKIGAKANELGMKLAYHNHDFEFEKINGEYALDVPIEGLTSLECAEKSLQYLKSL